MKTLTILFMTIALTGAFAKGTRDDIRDSRGVLLGWTDESYGRILLKDKLGRTVGYYVVKEDKTYRSNGTFVGKGNQLMRLLK